METSHRLKRDFFDWYVQYDEFVDDLHFRHPYADYIGGEVTVREKVSDDIFVEYLRATGEVLYVRIDHFWDKYQFDPNDVTIDFLVFRLKDLLADRPRF